MQEVPRPVEGKRRKTAQREKSTCDSVSLEASDNLKGSSEAEMTLQTCPNLGQGGWAFIFPLGSVTGCELTGKAYGFWPRTLLSKGEPHKRCWGSQPASYPAAGRVRQSFPKGNLGDASQHPLQTRSPRAEVYPPSSNREGMENWSSLLWTNITETQGSPGHPCAFSSCF